MPDPRFFSSAGPFTVSQLVKFADVKIAEGHSSQRLVSDVAPLDSAKSDDLSFLYFLYFSFFESFFGDTPQKRNPLGFVPG